MTKQTKRYYYDDTIKAAWMRKEHHIEYIEDDGEKVFLLNCPTNYIHPDCYALLEPKVGDRGIFNFDEDVKFYRGIWYRINDNSEIPKTLWAYEETEIIYRNGKAWFDPKVEEVDE